jgi:DNA recombination protein RmuC
MLEHCDFVEQPTAANDDARNQRPDVIVKLPGNKHIVIDAKVPIAAYLDAHEAADDAARARHLERHAELVRTHAIQLGRKAYWDTFSPSPDFVIMFMPDMLYTAALQQDAGLIEAVTSEKVVLATPGSLIALLRTIALGWREQALALNAQEVAQLGRQLYERVGSLAAHWSDVGDKLEKAVGSYNKSVGALESRVLVAARRFVDLKAATADDGELAVPQPVEAVPRPLLAPELTVVRETVGTIDRAMRVS